MNFGDWQSKENLVIDEDEREILKATQDLWRFYENPTNQEMGLFIAYFKDQKYGEQIHSPRHCLPGSGWKITNKEPFYVPIQSPPYDQLRINKLIISQENYNEVMLYWFWTRSGVITSEYELKFNLAKNALFRNPTDAAFIRINFPFTENNRSEVLQTASKFISDIFPAIKNILPFES